VIGHETRPARSNSRIVRAISRRSGGHGDSPPLTRGRGEDRKRRGEGPSPGNRDRNPRLGFDESGWTWAHAASGWPEALEDDQLRPKLGISVRARSASGRSPSPESGSRRRPDYGVRGSEPDTGSPRGLWFPVHRTTMGIGPLPGSPHSRDSPLIRLLGCMSSQKALGCEPGRFAVSGEGSPLSVSFFSADSKAASHLAWPSDCPLLASHDARGCLPTSNSDCQRTSRT
jgi:hypothetical protein